MAHASHTLALSLGLWAMSGHAALSFSPVRADAPAAARLALGAGIVQRSLEAPSTEGPSQLDFGPAPALMLGIDGVLREKKKRLGLGLNYRTSVLGRVADAYAGPGSSASKTPVRSHSFEAGLRAGVRLGDGPNAVALGLFAGYSVRAFASVAVLRVPRFSLHGPVLRLELDIPLQTAHMHLRLAPEIQWIASISAALRERAGLKQPALAIGAEAQLQLPLDTRFDLQLTYRESHAFVRTFEEPPFRDLERSLLLGVAYRVR